MSIVQNIHCSKERVSNKREKRVRVPCRRSGSIISGYLNGDTNNIDKIISVCVRMKAFCIYEEIKTTVHGGKGQCYLPLLFAGIFTYLLTLSVNMSCNTAALRGS